MLSKTKIAGFITVLMFISMPLVWADGAGHWEGGEDSFKGEHEGHHGDMFHLMSKVLNLTEDQQKQLKDVKQKQMETMKSVFEQMKSNREAFDAEILKASSDMTKINDLQAQIKTIQSQIVDNRLNSILEIKKILTPEQFAGYIALKKEKKLKMMEGHEKFGKNPGCCKMGEGHKHDQKDQGKDNDHEDKD